MERMLGNKYRIIKEVGSGGGGRVFQVYDCKLEKVWAAKRIDRKAGSLEEQVLQSVESTSFVRIVDSVEEGEERFLIMDWIEGESLQQRIDREGGLPVGEAVRIGLAVCGALEQLHAMEPPILYLDCKPSNIMLGADGRVLLVDFGSAVRCDKKAAPIAASPGYAAPEQQHTDPNQRRADERSDIYGLGKTMYAALGGQCPDRPPYGTLPLRRVNGAVPAGLCRAVEKCCAPDPQKRFQTAAAAAAALKGYEKSQHIRQWIWRGLCAGAFCLLFMAAWELAGWIMEVWQGWNAGSAVGRGTGTAAGWNAGTAVGRGTGTTAGWMAGAAGSRDSENVGNAGTTAVLLWNACAAVAALWKTLVQNGTSHLYRGLLWLTAAWAALRIIKRVFSPREPKWEMTQSVLRTLKKPGLWALLLAALLWKTPLDGQAVAAETGTREEWATTLDDTTVPDGASAAPRAPFVLRDEHFRKLLVREGTVLEVSDSIYIEIDPDFFEKEQIYEIRVTGCDGDGRETELALSLQFTPLLEDCPTFMQQ